MFNNGSKVSATVLWEKGLDIVLLGQHKLVFILMTSVSTEQV